MPTARANFRGSLGRDPDLGRAKRSTELLSQALRSDDFKRMALEEKYADVRWAGDSSSTLTNQKIGSIVSKLLN